MSESVIMEFSGVKNGSVGQKMRIILVLHTCQAITGQNRSFAQKPELYNKNITKTGVIAIGVYIGNRSNSGKPE
jgi:hypothetical protein